MQENKIKTELIRISSETWQRCIARVIKWNQYTWTKTLSSKQFEKRRIEARLELVRGESISSLSRNGMRWSEV